MTLLGEIRRWLQLPQPYRRSHFVARERWRPAYRIVASALLEHIRFDSVIDIGCGNGFLLSEFDEAGKTIQGLEVSPQVREVLPARLRNKVSIADFGEARGQWDLVCCVEVAEHLPAKRSEELVETLSRVAGDWIYFTAAPPGQPGHGHINCRPISDWLELFEAQGFEQAVDVTLRFRQDLLAIEGATWLINNSVILKRSSGSGRSREDASSPLDDGPHAEERNLAKQPVSKRDALGGPAKLTHKR